MTIFTDFYNFPFRLESHPEQNHPFFYLYSEHVLNKQCYDETTELYPGPNTDWIDRIPNRYISTHVLCCWKDSIRHKIIPYQL